MRSTHRFVKFIGMILATMLTIAIIGGACYFGIGVVKGIKNGAFKVKSSGPVINEETNVEEFHNINAEGGMIGLEIKVGDEYKVERVNVPEDYEVKIKVENDTLKIKTPDKTVDSITSLFGGKKHKKAKVVVTVPEGFAAQKIDITCGVGSIILDDLKTDVFVVNGGVGSIIAEGLRANSVDIDAGVGDIEFDDVDLANCNIQCGVGSIEISGRITGKNTLNGGVGATELKLEGARKDYSFDIDNSGLGSVEIDGENARGLIDTKEAANSFDIDAGVGSISIEFDD